MHSDKSDHTKENLQIGFLAFFLSTLFFTTFVNFDLNVSQTFFNSQSGFILDHTFLAKILRNIFRAIYIIGILYACLGLIITIALNGKIAARHSSKWIFLLLCVSIGPGLVANIILKKNWGRARPIQLEEFGGSKKFTPPLIRTNQCQTSNCSFVSGEASSIYAVFFALGMVSIGTIRRQLFIIGMVGGVSAGLVRVLQGRHFISDIIFAGIFMWLTVLLLWWLTYKIWPNRAAIYEKLLFISPSYIRIYTPTQLRDPE